MNSTNHSHENQQLLLSIFACHPVSSYWNIENPHRHCIDPEKYLFGSQIPNLLTDIALMILPLPFLWNLQMATSQKISMSVIFTLGSL